jgi:hypothetical protein
VPASTRPIIVRGPRKWCLQLRNRTVIHEGGRISARYLKGAIFISNASSPSFMSAPHVRLYAGFLHTSKRRILLMYPRQFSVTTPDQQPITRTDHAGLDTCGSPGVNKLVDSTSLKWTHARRLTASMCTVRNYTNPSTTLLSPREAGWFPIDRGSSGRRLFISVSITPSKVTCDGPYSNKLWGSSRRACSRYER